MRQFIIALFALFISSFCYAQESSIDVVYLQDGSIVRGQIVQKVPDRFIKIKTANGKITVYSVYEIKKIKKEKATTTETTDKTTKKKADKTTDKTADKVTNKPVNKTVDKTADKTTNKKTDKRADKANNKVAKKTEDKAPERVTYTLVPRDSYKAQKRSLKGYKAFIDLGYTSSEETGGDFSEISTSHGYQFNNYIFLGGGMAYHYYDYDGFSNYPAFIHFRANFINKKITPFGDLKTGYSFGDLEGTYAYMGIGVRFGLKKKKALNLSLGYSYQAYEVGDYESDIDGYTIRVGFEF